MLQLGRAADQRPCGTVLLAELGSQRGMRIGIVGVRQPAPMRHDLQLGYLLRIQIMLLRHLDDALDGRVGRTAAGVRLQAGIAGAVAFERCIPIAQHARRVIGARAVEHIQEALLVLERRRIGSEPSLRHQRSEQAVARCRGRHAAAWSWCRNSLSGRTPTRPPAPAPPPSVGTVRFSRRAAAATVPKIPSVAVGCQPLS